MTLAFQAYLDAGAEELERKVDALEGLDADASIPTCGGWRVEDLAEHLRSVYAGWRARLAAEGAGGLAPSGATIAPASAPASAARAAGTAGGAEACYEEGAALLVELAATGPAPTHGGAIGNGVRDVEGAEPYGALLARRLAVESALHRVDAELAAGSARPVEAELAADGIEERLEVHLRHELADDTPGSLGGTLCLVCSDLDVAHVIELSGGRLRWRRGRGPADAALVGTASELFLFSWRRLRLEHLSLTGRAEVAAAWAALPGSCRA